MQQTITPWRNGKKLPQGAALLFCMFVLTLLTLLVVSVLDTMTLELSALRNTIDYGRALYLANAGVHEAAANLESDSSWRGNITSGAYPADDSYTATAVDGPNSTVVVTSSGVAGAITRSIEATIEF